MYNYFLFYAGIESNRARSRSRFRSLFHSDNRKGMSHSQDRSMLGVAMHAPDMLTVQKI